MGSLLKDVPRTHPKKSGATSGRGKKKGGNTSVTTFMMPLKKQALV